MGVAIVNSLLSGYQCSNVEPSPLSESHTLIMLSLSALCSLVIAEVPPCCYQGISVWQLITISLHPYIPIFLYSIFLYSYIRISGDECDTNVDHLLPIPHIVTDGPELVTWEGHSKARGGGGISIGIGEVLSGTSYQVWPRCMRAGSYK